MKLYMIHQLAQISMTQILTSRQYSMLNMSLTVQVSKNGQHRYDNSFLHSQFFY